MRPLRPYQARAVERVREAALRGSRSIAVVAPTGSGKTRIAVEFVRMSTARGRSVLWLAHRAELLEQARDSLAAEGVAAGIVAPWAPCEPGPVQIASVQTLLARPDTRPPADLVVLDECHHMVAPLWSSVAADYASAFRIGLTATPERADGTALGELFTGLVAVAQPRELIAGGFLVPAEVWGPSRPVEGGLGAPVVPSWLAHARGARTIAFAANVEHAKQVALSFCAAGFAAECIDGDTPHETRQAAIARFAAGETTILMNVFVLTEGFDVPAVECVVLARGFTAASTYIQAVGRAMRPAPGKRRALILDLVGAAHKHGLPADDRVYSLAGRPIQRAENAEPIRQCGACGAVFAAAGKLCPRCGTIVPRPPTPAEKQARLERIRTVATTSDKQRSFDRLRAQAQARGYAAGWIAHRFKAIYGHWPDHRLWRAA